VPDGFTPDSQEERWAAALRTCTLCGKRCGVDRTSGVRGPCGSGVLPKVARWLPHMGEEPPLSGTRGSGTIFFSGCSLRCIFCQNYTISQEHGGMEIPSGRLVEIMLDLEARGCHNVNLVSPTHFVPQIVVALDKARGLGLSVPVVYNSHGYDSAEALGLLEGKVDIYLPDMKYACNSTARELSGVGGYREVNRLALSLMYAQVGHLQEDPDTGLAERGLIVRILVLPGGLAGVKESLLDLAQAFGPDLSLSLMAQYAPAHKARSRPPLDRAVTEEEYSEVVRFAEDLGFSSLWVQDPASSEVGVPDFSAETVFAFD